jgi:hypothetical protein
MTTLRRLGLFIAAAAMAFGSVGCCCHHKTMMKETHSTERVQGPGGTTQETTEVHQHQETRGATPAVKP